jgi:hypothetical protein
LALQALTLTEPLCLLALLSALTLKVQPVLGLKIAAIRRQLFDYVAPYVALCNTFCSTLDRHFVQAGVAV